MSDEQLELLKKAVAADNPEAMFAYSQYIRAADPAEADKYVLLAAHLGHPEAQERYADFCMAKGDYDNAAYFYGAGAKAGRHDCAVKRAVMRLSDENDSALHELEELAEGGVVSACSALAAYYKAKGNRRAANYWKSFIK